MCACVCPCTCVRATRYAHRTTYESGRQLARVRARAHFMRRHASLCNAMQSSATCTRGHAQWRKRCARMLALAPAHAQGRLQSRGRSPSACAECNAHMSVGVGLCARVYVRFLQVHENAYTRACVCAHAHTYPRAYAWDCAWDLRSVHMHMRIRTYISARICMGMCM